MAVQSKNGVRFLSLCGTTDLEIGVSRTLLEFSHTLRPIEASKAAIRDGCFTSKPVMLAGFVF